MRPLVFLSLGFLVLNTCANGDDKDPDGAPPGGDIYVGHEAGGDAYVPPDLPQYPDQAPSDLPQSPDQPGTPVDAGPLAIVITEYIPNPQAVSDGDGEWVEIYNAGSATVDLAGWTLKDDGSDSHVIQGPLTIAAGQYLVLAKKIQSSVNGGVNAAYEYADFYQANSADEVVLVSKGGAEVDRVAYDTTWGISAGATMQLRGVSLDNNVAANWCISASAWTGSAGDFGTPGASNSCPQPDGGVADAGPDGPSPDVGPAPDGPSPDMGPGPDGPAPDGMGVPMCPPAGSTPSNPATGLGDLDGQPCNYACWGSGTIYNQCATNYWQYCLPGSQVFAPCQAMP